MSYRTAEFNKLDDEFAYAAEPILNETDLSIEALQHLLDAYNALISYAEIDFDRKKKNTKEHIKQTIEANRITLKLCYQQLNLSLSLPGTLLSTIHYIPSIKQVQIQKLLKAKSRVYDLMLEKRKNLLIRQKS